MSIISARTNPSSAEWQLSFYAFGIIAGAFTPTVMGTCLPSGTPVAATPSWATSGRFCSTTALGGGCNAGQVCVPYVATPPGRCQMYDGAHACPTGATSTAWYTGYTGTQGCTGCSCSVSTAASCAAMKINIGSDSGLSPGNSLIVFRGNEYIGDLALTTVEPKAAVGKFSPARRAAKVKEGDSVISSFGGTPQ